MTYPCTSGRVSSQRSPFSRDAKKLRTGQQLEHDSPPPLAPQTTTASAGSHAPCPAGVSSTSMLSPVSGSRETISIDSSSIEAIPRASIAHIACTSCPLWKRTT
jgi:hypothetical protein